MDDAWHMLQLLELYLAEWFDAVELLRFQNGDQAWDELSRMEPIC